MLKNTTFNLPDDLVARAKSYAATHGTTMTALVRAHLEAITASLSPREDNSTLRAYSQGKLSRADAISQLGLRDHAALLIALGDADLPMPSPPPHVVENEAAMFARLFKQQ